MARRQTLAALALIFALAACAEITPPAKDKADFAPVGFSDLPGWEKDTILDAVPALTKSCAVLEKKPEWTQPCAALAHAAPATEMDARRFLVRWFRPYAVGGRDGANGLFTGYYEAELQGAAQKSGAFQTPLYARPDDLITVDLGAFKSDLKGQTIVGKVVDSRKGKKLEPYDDRATIAKGSLSGRADILAWVNDPVDAFFLAIQGSGRVQMQDGSVLRVGYDATNSRAYVAIGRVLADSGEVEKPVTMQKIRAWLAAHPDRAQTVMNTNPSYVFFRLLKDDGPIGAEGVALTPQRSLAVDPAFIALGTPVWLDTGDGEGHALQRLVVAQDTGGAIKGAVRGDVFWGYGKDAETQAGAMQSPGRYFILLPRASGDDAKS